MSNPKILLFDIETAPSTSYIWGLWQEVKSTDFIISDWYVMCWSAKWLGEKDMMSSSLPEFQEYKTDREYDKGILVKLHKLLDEADIVIAHNGKKFDCKKINTRFIRHGLRPPSPFRVVDTLTIAKKEFAFTSNRLDSLGQFLDVGRKVKTGGFELWKKCMAGDKKAWDRMVRYCRGDVRLLERVYKKMLPYSTNHPKLDVFTSGVKCMNCQSKNVHYRGYAATNSHKYRRFQCQKCGAWGRERKSL